MTTTSSTRFENGSAADLALNVKVEAEGQIDANGVLVATKVQFKRQGSARIEARVDSVDHAANKLVVLGIDVTVNVNTRVEDNGDQRVANFNLGNSLQATSSKCAARTCRREQRRRRVAARTAPARTGSAAARNRGHGDPPELLDSRRDDSDDRRTDSRRVVR